MKRIKQLLTGCSLLVLLSSCTNTQSPAVGIPATAVKQIGGSQHVKVLPGRALSEGAAAEAFHTAAQTNQEAGAYAYKDLTFQKNNHARTSSHGLTSPYGATAGDVAASMIFNMVSINKDKPSTYSTSSFTQAQIPHTLAKGTSVRVKTLVAQNHIDDMNAADLSAISTATQKAVSQIGLKPSQNARHILTVRVIRAAKESHWVSAELIFQKHGTGRKVKAFIMAKAKENTPGAGESVQVISEALGRMLTVR